MKNIEQILDYLELAPEERTNDIEAVLRDAFAEGEDEPLELWDEDTPHFKGASASLALSEATNLMQLLTPYERLIVFSQYCTECGESGFCQC